MDLQNTDYGVVSGEMFMSEEARLGDWVIKVIANVSFDWLIDWLIYCLIDWLSEWASEWLSDLLID